MNTRDAQIALENDFFTRWANETPIGFDNTNFHSENLAEFTLFTVRFTAIRQSSLGLSQGQQKQHGFFSVQFFTELEKGSQRTMALVDKVVGLLSGVRVGSILVHTPNVNVVGETAKWYVSDVTFDFEYDFIR